MPTYKQLRPNGRTAHEIAWIVGNHHVSEPLWQVAKDIRDRIRKGDPQKYRAPKGSDDRTLVAEAILYARRCHLENRRLYTDVMGGKL